MIQKLVSVAKWLSHMPCKLRIVGSIQDLSIFSEDFKRATDEGSLPEIAQYSPSYLPLNVFTASKGSNLLYFI